MNSPRRGNLRPRRGAPGGGSRAAARTLPAETRTGAGGGLAPPPPAASPGRGRRGRGAQPGRGGLPSAAPPGPARPQTFTLPPLRKFSTLVTSGPPQPMGVAGDILGGGRGGTAPRALARLPCTVHGERAAGGERSSGWERRRLRPLRLPSPPPGPGSAGRLRGGAGPRRQQPSGGRERLRSLRRGRPEFPVAASAGYLPCPGGAMRSGGGCFGDCRRF